MPARATAPIPAPARARATAPESAPAQAQATAQESDQEMDTITAATTAATTAQATEEAQATAAVKIHNRNPLAKAGDFHTYMKRKEKNENMKKFIEKNIRPTGDLKFFHPVLGINDPEEKKDEPLAPPNTPVSQDSRVIKK